MSITLVFGGTFDPVHTGHIALSRALLELFADARLVLVPCQIPVHRDAPTASAQQRYEMLRLATQGIKRLHIDDCELRRTGPSYTIDTLRAYRRELGDHASLIFVMGMDSWLSLTTWHCWKEMCDLAHLIVLPRAASLLPDETDNKEPPELQQWSRTRVTTELEYLASTPGGKVLHARLEQVDISATRVRDLLARGEATKEVLDPRVYRYILQHGLYQAASPSRAGTNQAP